MVLVASKEMGLLDCVTGAAHSMRKDTEQTSHRAESFGILGGILLANKLYTRWGITVGQVTIACDNISALRYAMDCAY
jgi:hypothetical protein